ncbi:MAG: cobalamin-binding protein [Acidobacteria bacterium]|nr:cobalamin-binding protein [Acidobacteriota bacterium]
MKQLRLSAACLLIFLTAGGVGSCYRNVPPPREVKQRNFTDDLGKTISLPENVDSVVSLAPNLTEIIFAVGAGDKLVGVTTFCNYPTEAKNIRKVSDTQKPNIESIVAIKPQIVFVSTASQLEAFTKTLAEQKIAVFVTNPNSLDDIYRSIEQIGNILGKKDKAETLVQNLKKRAAEARGPIVYGSLPKVFVQIDKDSLYTIGRESYITDIIARAGGVSATADLATAYPKISRETALAMNPDVIVISESDNNREPNEAFRNSPAVKNGRVFKINADLLSRPGPRVVDALEKIAEQLRSER